MTTALPVEIIEHIVRYLAGNPTALAACALASRLLLALARPVLFRTIHLSSPATPTRLLSLLTASPYLSFLIAHLEISFAAATNNDLESLLSIFFSLPADEDGRYHGAGHLHSVSLIEINWRSLSPSIHRAMLGLLSCSSITTITLDSNFAFNYINFAYFSPNLCTLNLFSRLVSPILLPPADILVPSLTKPVHPARITSLGLMDSTTASLLARYSFTLNLSHINSARIFIESSFLWSNFLSMFKRATTLLSPLRTLSLIFAPFGKSYHERHGYVLPSDASWLGFDLSDRAFHNLRTLKIYAHSGHDALPVCHSLFFWIANTLDTLPQRKCHLESLSVHILVSSYSLANLGLAGDWAKLVKALRRIKLARVDFVIKLERRGDLVKTMYDQFERHVRKRLLTPFLRKTKITIDKVEIIWSPRDAHSQDIWFEPAVRFEPPGYAYL